ncbi:MAG TPA: gephyrin-like molybdotransferase Glp [Anaerolineales bacterium]|jgi:molybdopterin molybdotransferase
MPEFLTLLPPVDALSLLVSNIKSGPITPEIVETRVALGRITFENVNAPSPLPAFPRSTVDGYALRARDTYGASENLPGYLTVSGEIPMGMEPRLAISSGECALIHTGGMLPSGADAVIMLEYTEAVRPGEIEIQRSVGTLENVIQVGEDVAENQVVIPRGTRLRPAEIGGLMALGVSKLRVANKPRVGLVSSGDEVIPPDRSPQPGQVRDINSYSLASLIAQFGGEPEFFGIVPDRFDLIQATVRKALGECDLVIVTAGSSASTRDMTAEVISSLGKPGVLVHGINTRPGKPTILGVCGGKPVIGLPGNPVSALVNGYLFVVPVVEKLMGLQSNLPKPSVRARLTVNLASQAGREDWQPVKLVSSENGWLAEPIFGKSNLIFTLAAADGMIKIHADANGIDAGELVDVFLMV